MNNVWENISSGKFWASGSMIYNAQQTRFVQSFPISNKEMARMRGSQVTDDVEFYYHLIGWDTAILAGRDHVYTPDEKSFYHYNTSMYRPCARQCMTNYLGQEEQAFLIDAFNRAYTEMKKHCEQDCFASVMLLSRPVTSVPMHIHTKEPSTTFTYVISSGVNDPATSVLVEDTKADYPKDKEFFILLDTSKMHGTRSLDHDRNHYLYFVFDGVRLNTPLEYNKIYTV